MSSPTCTGLKRAAEAQGSGGGDRRRAGEVGEEVAGLGQQELADEDGGAFDGGGGDEFAVGVIEAACDPKSRTQCQRWGQL